jgi:hypothetical protein
MTWSAGPPASATPGAPHEPAPPDRAYRLELCTYTGFIVVISRSCRLASVVDRGNNPHLNPAMRLGSLPHQAKEPAAFKGISERMMGLEPTTFCMAKAGKRSRQFASVR